MNQPWKVIADLESDNSRLAKEAIVAREAQAGNQEFFRGCRAALDPMITYGIRQVELKKGDGRGVNPDTFWRTAQDLADRRLTGNAAITAVNALRMNAREEEWNGWYRRILIKDLRCGVTEKTINSVVKKIRSDYEIPVFACQLAHDGANHESKVSGEKLIEVKLDGVRVITVVYPDGTVTQYSRNGKELVNFEHIKEQISRNARLFGEPTVLDGEVMSNSFQDLMRQVHRKSDVEAKDAILHLFDIVSLAEFQAGQSFHSQLDRSRTLSLWYRHIGDSMPNVRVLGQELVDLDTVAGQTRFAEINSEAIEGGYEGIMIKDIDAVYECKRSHAWLKQKPFIEISLEIADVEEGTGRNQGKLGAFVCEGVDDGRHIRVNVGSGFTDDQRETFWMGRFPMIGQVIEIRADAITQNQDGSYSLRFPRFLRFRGFEAGEKI
jgi:DNA ligase-1